MENKVNNIIEGEKVSNYRYNISFRKKFIRLFVYQFTVIVVVYVSFMNYIYTIYIKGVYFLHDTVIGRETIRKLYVCVSS